MVHGERDSKSGEVAQNTLFTFFSKAEAYRAATIMNWTVIASFHQMNARRAVATVGSENIGSIRVLEKIGIFREAFYEKDVQLRDRWRDSYLYAVGREEFLRQKINESI